MIDFRSPPSAHGCCILATSIKRFTGREQNGNHEEYAHFVRGRGHSLASRFSAFMRRVEALCLAKRINSIQKVVAREHPLSSFVASAFAVQTKHCHWPIEKWTFGFCN